jgi:hypothetical protein
MKWHVYVAAALLSGCQAIQSFDDTRTPNDLAFENMWNRYTHCRSSSSMNQIWQDAQQLNRTVHRMDQAARASRLLPDTIEQSLAEPPPRLAVDPKAMAAACTLLAGQAAQNEGHAQFAAEMFGFVLANFAESRYAYYQEQAQVGIDQIEGTTSDQVVTMFDQQLDQTNPLPVLSNQL